MRSLNVRFGSPLPSFCSKMFGAGGAPGLPSPVTAFIVFMFVAVFSCTTMSTVAGNSTLPLT